VFKRNEISIFAHGDFPLWFDKTLSEKMRKNPINIAYEIEDHKLNILRYLSKGYISPRSGKMSLKGSFGGTYEKIKNNGRLLITEGSFRTKNYIKDMSVEISIIENLIKIDKLHFKSGSGKLNIYGQLELDNFNVSGFDIRLVTDDKGFFLRVPQLPIPVVMGSKAFLQDYSAGELNFDVRVQGTPVEPKVSGSILLENTRFTFPGNADGESLDFFIPENTEFDLKLATAKNTRFQNSFVYALINGFLYLRGPYNNLRTNGIIEASTGRIDYLGLGFNILSAKVEIINAIDGNHVYIDVEGETKIFSKTENELETIKLIVDKSEISNISHNSIRFSSKDNPNMNSRKVLEKIIRNERDTSLGMSEIENVSDFNMKQRALRLVDQTFASPFTKVFLRKTGLIDDFRVSYVQAADGVYVAEDQTFANLFSGTKYSAEKNLTNQILFGYSITFNEFDRKFDLHHEIGGIYKFTNSLFLVGSYELEFIERDRRPDRKLTLQYQMYF
jgi:hypothetical protein